MLPLFEPLMLRSLIELTFNGERCHAAFSEGLCQFVPQTTPILLPIPVLISYGQDM